MMHRRIVLAFLVLAGLLMAPAQVLAQEQEPAPDERRVMVVMKNGQRISGVLVSEDDDRVVVRIGRVETPILREHVDRVIVQRSARERYDSMREVIRDDDIDQLLLLIDWLRAEGLLDEAHEEVTALLAREPNNGQALQLKALVEQQRALRDRGVRDGAERPVIQPRGRPTSEPRRPLAQDFPLLSEEDTNLVKVYELDLRNPPRLLIERPTIDKLITGYRGQAGIPMVEAQDQAFRRRPAEEILAAMFQVRARELYPEVRVLGLPESLRRFRDDVNSTWLVNHCGTTACHGGMDAGSFMLFNRTPTAERAALTNLMILERHQTPDGLRLLNYDQPEQSLLLQYALSPQLSARPHPQVRGYAPVFRSTRSRRYVQAMEWMASMHQPRPEHPIEFVPPRPEDFARGETESGQPAPDREQPDR